MAAGQWRIGRRAVVNGQRAVELAWRSQPTARAYLGPGPNVPGHQVLQLWVSARTHLPVRLVSFVAVAARQHGPAAGPATVTQVIVYDCRFLAPTTANLAQLRVQVPKGFRRIHMGP
jgi:hypothetical protein